MRGLVINSNSGWDKIEFIPEKIFFHGEIELICFRISYSSLFWDRGDLDKIENLRDEKSIAAHQVMISTDSWNQLFAAFKGWRMDNSKLFSIDLSSINGQHVNAELLVDKNLISSSQKPIFVFSLVDGKSTIIIKMIIDQSCILQI